MNGQIQIPMLGGDPCSPFPSSHTALSTPNGLLAWGGDLQPERLLMAYRQGIFPWYSEGQPILWWSPAPRCVLNPRKVYLSTRTRRRYNSRKYTLSLNRSFRDVVLACSEPRKDDQGTWITAEMADAYTILHESGHAHSVEVWQGDKLVGGIYGLAIGAMFFGESMFSRSSDASKVALVALCRLMTEYGYPLMDCQVDNPHLLRMGAELMSRNDFETTLRRLVASDDVTHFRSAAPRFDQRW